MRACVRACVPSLVQDSRVAYTFNKFARDTVSVCACGNTVNATQTQTHPPTPNLQPFWIWQSRQRPQESNFRAHMMSTMDAVPVAKAKAAVRKRPAAAKQSSVREHHAKALKFGPTGRVERPLLPRSRSSSTGPISYASDCSGLDAGAMALQTIVPKLCHHWASEVDPCYKSILRATHPDVNVYFDDVAERSEEALEPYVDRVTIYTSGFPCTPFSSAGGQMGVCDPSAGMLSFYVVLTICQVLPCLFILENVPDFATDAKHQQHFDVTLRMLRNAGGQIYNIYWRILNSKDYGVPAQRQRFYIVGIRRDKSQSAWAWPPEELPVGLHTIFDATPPTKQEHDATIAALPPFSLDNLAAGLELVNKTKSSTPTNMSKTGPWVIDIGASRSRLCNPTYNAMPTITKARAKKRQWYVTGRGLISESELMRCQGFEPSRVVVPSDINRDKVCEMVGNAMTVSTMERLLRSGLRALNML